MTIISPSFKETLLYGPANQGSVSRARVTYDLRTSYGAYLLARVGRGGSGEPTQPFGIYVYRNPRFTSTGGSNPPYNAVPANYTLGHPGPVFSALSSVSNASATTVSVNASAGATTVTVASATGFSVGDVITFNGNGNYFRWEVNRITRINGSVFTLETPLIFAHTAAQADDVINKCEIFTASIDGGAMLEILLLGPGTNSGWDVEIFLQEYTNDVTA